MGSLSLRVRYRPVRIGWCVESQRAEHITKALRVTHALAGGRFNPLIPVDIPQLADDLVDKFRVDILYPVAATDAVDSFVKAHDHYLHWPSFDKELFHQGWEHVPPRCAFADVYHAARRLRANRTRRRKVLLVTWEDGDPLALALLAMVGTYPAASDQIPDYTEILAGTIGVEPLALKPTDVVPPEIRTRVTPSRLTTGHLQTDDRFPGGGVFLGDANRADDVISFWNLRAAGASVVFYDARHADRFAPLLDAHRRWLASLGSGNPRADGDALQVYRRDARDGSPIPSELGRVRVLGAMSVKPALHYWEERQTLGSVDESGRKPSLAFALPERPFYEHPHLSQQQIAVTVRGSDPSDFDGKATFFPPYIPELNEYYGRELHFHYAKARAEPRSIWSGITLLLTISDANVTLHALPSVELARRLFTQFGIKASISAAGQVTARLIAQMEDLQGCRVFKIEGVRTLIAKHAPDQSFSRTAAVMTIGNNDPTTSKPRFEPFEDLFIAPRDKPKLTPHDALDFLLERGVFRAGLNLACPHCELRFWVSLDDAKTTALCEYCGKHFGTTTQLRDRDWAYRRSGLFGRNDHQGGGIPVALLLQQLDTLLSDDRMLYSTSLELAPDKVAIDKCETDFVVLCSDYSERAPNRPQLIIGECKSTGGAISRDDALHLAKVADAFPERRVGVFVLFAKTGTFAADEIEACALAQHQWHPRVIVLGKDELEPYHVDGRYQENERLRSHSLDALAQDTIRRFPPLRCKADSEA